MSKAQKMMQCNRISKGCNATMQHPCGCRIDRAGMIRLAGRVLLLYVLFHVYNRMVPTFFGQFKSENTLV